MDKLRSGVGEMLRIAMRENNVTQEMLAKYLYTTQQTVSRWCKGICEPDLVTLMRICSYFGTTPDEMLSYSETEMEKLREELNYDK